MPGNLFIAYDNTSCRKAMKADVCADFVHSKSIKRAWQGTLDKFFWQ
jgi:hypothetical protein